MRLDVAACPLDKDAKSASAQGIRRDFAGNSARFCRNLDGFGVRATLASPSLCCRTLRTRHRFLDRGGRPLSEFTGKSQQSEEPSRMARPHTLFLTVECWEPTKSLPAGMGGAVQVPSCFNVHISPLG